MLVYTNIFECPPGSGGGPDSMAGPMQGPKPQSRGHSVSDTNLLRFNQGLQGKYERFIGWAILNIFVQKSRNSFQF